MKPKIRDIISQDVTRRVWVIHKAIAISLICLALTSCAATDTTARSHDTQRPNIIFILADDLSFKDCSFMGQEQFKTPHIDRLAHSGLVFLNAYAGAPECAPSRASLLTGMQMGHCRIRANASARGQDHLTRQDQTVAKILKRAGYACGMVGKWGVGLPQTEGVPSRQGFDYSFGFYDQRRAHTYFPHYMMENDQVIARPRYTDDPLFKNKGPWDGGKFMCRDGGGRVPFFVCWPGRIMPGQTNHVCALYDFLETAAELAGVTPDQPTDGISLVPILMGREHGQRKHRYLYLLGKRHIQSACPGAADGSMVCVSGASEKAASII